MKNMNRYDFPLKGRGLLSVWRFNLLIGICSLLLGACSNENKRQEPTDFIEIDMVPLIEGEAQKMPLQEWAKSVRFISLDTDADVSYKSIDKVFQRGDTLLVHHAFSLSVFDINGKYLYDIGSKSSIPSENVKANFVCLHDDLIYALEHPSIKVYDWKGKFIKKIDLPSKVWDVFPCPGKEEMLAYVANQSGEELVRFYRMKGEEVLDTVFNPFIYKRPENVREKYFGRNEFRCSVGSLKAFIEMGSDTVYRVDEHLQTHPYIVFNMGKHLYTRMRRYNETSEEWVKRIYEGNEWVLKVTGEVNDKIYIYNDRKLSMIREVLYVGDTYCYDKATEETNKYFLTYEENDWGISPDAFFEPRSIVEDKYLVDWESSGHGNNAVLVLVEP